MTNKTFSLSEDFSPVSYETWRAVVEKALDGADFDKRLTTRLYDGLTLKPLYTREDWSAVDNPSGFPGFPPFVRGSYASGVIKGWDIRQCVRHPDVVEANKEVLEELERGATSVLLRLDSLSAAGRDPDSAEDGAQADGIVVASVDDLDTVLKDVRLDLVPIALDAGAGGFATAAFLAEIWKRRKLSGPAVRGAFNVDPLGFLAATGSLPMGSDAALKALGALGMRTARDFPRVTSVGVDVSAYSRAGASDSDDLAYAMATAVVYLRALVRMGLGIDAACSQIAFTIPVGSEFFPAIAKLRAARMLWARVTEACEASSEMRRMRLFAVTADRVLTRCDPWVNLLRTTVASFAGGVAGADSVTAVPFTEALGLPTGFARRIARNTQIILQEESNVSRVIDPAGGSWFLETLTRQLAESAWVLFQNIEMDGGMLEVLTSGKVADHLGRAWEERRRNLGRRKDQITGVSEFPNLSEAPVDVLTVDSSAVYRRAVSGLCRYERHLPGKGYDALHSVAAKGTLGALTAVLGEAATTIDPLPRHRLAEDFESLRTASDSVLKTTGARPKIFLANMGRVAQHTARATYSRNFFEAGGIETISNDGFADVADAAAAFKASGARIAVLCGSDSQYEESAVLFARALKESGALHVTLAGRPGEKKADYDAAGVDDYIYLGCDVLGALRAAHARLGIRAGA